MNSDILTFVQERFDSFSKGQRLIARYLREEYDKAAFITANKLGQAVGVSESTVVRFAMELGYDGYPAMQKALQEMILNRLTSVQRIEVSNDRLGSGDVITAVLQADLDKIRETNETADRKSFDAAVDALLAAKRIYILGVRSSAALAGFLGYYFNFIFDDVRIVTSASAGEMTEQISRIRPEDAAIGISFPRYSSATIEAVRFCREAGAAVIGLTDSCTSPVGANAGIVLTAKSDMVSLVDSLTAPMSLINALIVAVASRREKTVSTTFTELERIWGEYNIYEK